MPPEPAVKRTCAFVDGQNLFYASRAAFGYRYPNYDPLALARAVCSSRGWRLDACHFYTGIPAAEDNAFWNHFWSAKLAAMGTRGVTTFARPLRYRNQTITLSDGRTITTLVGQEKGVDVRLALDVVRLARRRRSDVGLVFSQDQDLSEVADEVKAISIDQDRWIKLACAFPLSPTTSNRRGINGTDWVPISRSVYDACIDTADYRPRKP